MSRIRQHLPFSKNLDSQRNMDSKLNHLSLSGDLPFGANPTIDKTAFMNNICSCLDSCSAYIQALNSLCAAGTVLAHSLLQVFQELPPYRDLAEQFVTTWEEMSKATAGASSGVKTETLMALQEVLNRLEEENSQLNGSPSSVHNNKSVMENIKAVGSCLLSYVELQAQFSLSCWKSLSQISKNSESLVFFCLPRGFGFQEPAGGLDSLSNQSAIVRAPQDLVISIRKYFGQVMQKTIPNAATAPPSQSFYSNFGENVSESPISGSKGMTTSVPVSQMAYREQPGLPPTAANRWVHHSLHSSMSAPSSYGKMPLQKCRATSSPIDSNSNKEGSVPSELDEVLNLLSCQPNEPPPPPQPRNSNEKNNNTFLNNVLNAAENLPLNSGSLSLQSVPWGVNHSKEELLASSDSAIHTGLSYQNISYEGKRTWPRMGSSGGGGDENSPFSFGGWVWGHPERGLSGNMQSSSITQSSNQGPHRSSHKESLVNWCTNSINDKGTNRWSSGQAENSSSDEGSNSNNGQDNNEVFYPLGGLGYVDLVLPPNGPGNRQRRHSSNDGLPDGCNNLPHMDPPVEKPLNTCIPWQDGSKTVKTSTWPLKQNVNSRLGVDGLMLGGIQPMEQQQPPALSQSPLISDRVKVLDRQDMCESNEGCLRVASLVERWGGGMCTQSDKNKDEKKYTLFGQIS